jgi:hypothetical protein
MPFQNRRSPRARLLLAVALAHAALLLLIQAAGVWRDRQARVPDREPLIVQLLAAPPVVTRPAMAPAASPARAAQPAPPAPAAREPEALQAPAAAALPQPPLAAVESAPPRPLLLDLPRKASAPLAERHPGPDDPRANSARPTLESRIARAVGSAELVEEHLGEGRLRFRKGSGCVELRPNAAGQLEPFNESVRPSNRLATNC